MSKRPRIQRDNKQLVYSLKLSKEQKAIRTKSEVCGEINLIKLRKCQEN